MVRKKIEPMPTAEELLKQAEMERRRIRRARRHAIKRGEDPDAAMEQAKQAPPPGAPKTPLPYFPPVEGGMAKSPEEMRDMFNQAFDELGGVQALVAWGRNYPKEFYPMWARLCIPKAAEGGGADGGIEDLLSEIDDD